MGTSKHSGSISLYDKEFVKKEIFDKELSKSLHRAFELRRKDDYMEEAEVTKEDVDDLFSKATDFVNKIKAYLGLGLK